MLKSFMLLFFVKARITVELSWNTEKLSHQCCESKNQLLLWNFTEAESETVMELQWFFSETTLICLDSKTIGFQTETSYKSRIERNGKAGILLKNISLYDAGKYTLYVKLAEEKIRNVQNIILTVYEKVPTHCKPHIEIQHEMHLSCSTTCSARSNLSSEWITKGTGSSEDIGPYLKASDSEEALCCLRGLCLDDQSCIPNPISSKIFKQGHQNESNNFKAGMDEGSHTIKMLLIMCVLTMALIIIFIITIACFMLRRCKSLKTKNPKASILCTEDHHEIDTISGTTVKTKTPNAGTLCTEDHNEIDTIAETTDRPLHRLNSNQNIQIVNNINMDREHLKYMVEVQRLSNNLEAIKEEIREWKSYCVIRPHSQEYETRHFDNYIEMKEEECHHANNSLTDASEMDSDDYEDAVSEPFIPFRSGSIQRSLSGESPSNDEHGL